MVDTFGVVKVDKRLREVIARELGITEVVQGREDKREALLELCERTGLSAADCAYMGDDLPDLGAIQLAGLKRFLPCSRRMLRIRTDTSPKSISTGQGFWHLWQTVQ